jgi:hypothetical protein
VEGNSSREVEVLVLVLFTEAVDASYIQNLLSTRSSFTRSSSSVETKGNKLINRPNDKKTERKETDRTT